MTGKMKWIAVAACVLLVCLAGVASAGTTGNLNWDLTDGVLTISGNGAMPDYDYDPATSGGKYDDPEPEWVSTPWWNSAYSVQRIVVGEGVTSIGKYAFYGCTRATEVSLPTTLTNIDAHAFEKNYALTGIELPEGLKTIGASAFYGAGLTGTLTLPDGLETLGTYALNCSQLTEVIFGSALENMDLHSVPTSVTLTSSNGSNGEYEGMTWCLAGHVLILRGSGDMPAFTRTANTYKGEILGYSYSMPWYTAGVTGSVHKVMISYGITSISSYAFVGMRQMTSVSIPSGVTKIGNSAFINCSALTAVTIPSAVTSIGASAFEGCRALQKVDIPSGVTTIPGNAFYECYGLTQVSIPESVTSIGQNAFYGCSNIHTVLYNCTSINTYNTYGGYAGNWSYITFNGMYANPMAASGEAKLYSNGYEVAEVHLPTDAASVSDWAYYKCQNNFKVVGNGGYTGEIGQYAFYNCSGLTSIELPTSVYRVNQYAFHGCSNVTYTYMLFDGLVYSGDYAFYGCTGLTTVNQNNYSGNALSYVGIAAFGGCTNLNTVRMKASEGTIKNYAFGACTGLNSVTFLEKAPATIEAYAFNNTATQVNYYDGASWTDKVKNYNGTLTWKAAGGSCGPNATWKLTDKGKLIISGSGEVTSEAWQAENGITALEIGNDITGAWGISFAKVSGAQQGTLNEDNRIHWVLTPAGVLHVFGTGAMPDLTAGHTTWTGTVTDARIHEGITKIGAYAFNSEQSAGLANIRMPGTLAEIRRSAFEGCRALTDLYFPDPVPTVYPDAFKGVTANAWYLYTSMPGTISSGELTWRTYCAWENGAAVMHELALVEALEPTCTENGYIEHWLCAKCENLFEEENAIQVLEEEDILLNMTGHRWTTEPVFLWADSGKACEVTFTCLNCEITETGDAEITSEPAVEPTDTTGGETVYTATAVSPNGKTYTDTKRVADIPARFTWSGTTITKYNLQEERVVIPETATKLGTVAFKNCTSIRLIVIPDSVTEIGPNTFGGCSEELTICSSENAYAHQYALEKGINWKLYIPEPVMNGWFGVRGMEAGLDATAEYFVAEGIGIETVSGALYSTDHLFTWEIGNMDALTPYLTEAPTFTVTLESGDVAFRTENFAYGNEAGIDVMMTALPAPGNAEFKATCTIGGDTYEQTVRFTFTGISTLPTKLEGDLESPKTMKIGDAFPFYPQISFENGWSVGTGSGTLYGAGDEFFDLIDWQNGPSVARTGRADVPLVAYAANLYMEETVTYLFTNENGTIPALTISQNGATENFVHGQDIVVAYDLSGYTFTEAELHATAWYNNHYYDYPDIPLTGKTGTYTFTDTAMGDAISFRVTLKDTYDGYLPGPGEEPRAEYTDSWTGKPAVPAFAVTYRQSSVTAGTPISADYSITGYTGNLSRCEVNWGVYDQNGQRIASTRHGDRGPSGTAELDAPTVKGTHCLTASVMDGSSWTFQFEDREQGGTGIEVTTDGTSAPLDITLEWTDENGNAFDWTKDRAEQDQQIFLNWEMTGGYTPYEGYLNISRMTGNTNFDAMGRDGARGTLDFTVWGSTDVMLEIEYHDDHGNSQMLQATIPIVPEQIGPGPGPGDGIAVMANFQQEPGTAGQPVDLDWTIGGGSGSYTDVQVEWKVHEGPLQKILQTEHFTGATGTTSFTPPMIADQVEAIITVTDSEGETGNGWAGTWLEGYEDNNRSGYSVYNIVDAVAVGGDASGRWQIGSGRHTISNVRYRWVTTWKDSDGYWQETDETGWISAGNAMSGSASFTTVRAGNLYLNVAFDAEDGWSCPGGRFDPIQVFENGEVPLTANISFSPTNPKAGDEVTISWNLTGSTAQAQAWSEWRLSNMYGDTLNSGDAHDIPMTGSMKVTTTEGGMLCFQLHIEDDERGLRINPDAYVEITETSGITLSVTPQAPELGEPVTISWQIDRQNYDNARLMVTLKNGNLVKDVSVDADLTESRSGSATFTPEEGDAMEIVAQIWDGPSLYEEKTGDIPLQGSWEAPDPIVVTLSYRTEQDNDGNCIAADYEITGGSGKYAYICGTWVRIEPDGRRSRLHDRVLESTTGQTTYTPDRPGNYALIFRVVDDESGWEFNQTPDEASDPIAWTNGSGEPLGISFYDGLPDSIRRNDWCNITWDVTGGDDSENRVTDVHVETDDGIVLAEDTVWNFTCHWGFGTDNVSDESKSVIISLTPSDNTSTGQTVTRVIPIDTESAPTQLMISNNRNGAHQMNFYLGMRYEEYTFFTGEVQTEPQIDHFYLDNKEQMAAAYPQDEPEWKMTKISGTAELRMDTIGYDRDMDLELRQLPNGPEDGVWKIECDWGPMHWETLYTVHFMNSPTGLPTGIDMDFGTVLVVRSGQRIGLADKVRFKNGWNIPGEHIDTMIGGDVFNKDAVTHDEQWIWDIANAPGVCQANASKLCGNIRWIEDFTLIVTNADGTLPANEYTPIGTVTVLPAAIREIESEAFAGTKLTEVDIPAGTMIADDAFDGTGLIAVYTHNDPDTIAWAVNHGIVALTEP